jgi:hypothetical protein
MALCVLCVSSAPFALRVFFFYIKKTPLPVVCVSNSL